MACFTGKLCHLEQEIDTGNSDMGKEKEIQARSFKRRNDRQYQLIAKRARKWYSGTCQERQHFAMFYLKKGEIVSDGPGHMEPFLRDPLVIAKFKEVALGRAVTFNNETVVADVPIEKVVLPYQDPAKYTWDSLVFLLPAILAREGIKGKHAYCEQKKPTWWPASLRFCSPNSSSADAKDMVFGRSGTDSDSKTLISACEGIKLNLQSLYSLKDKLSDEIIDSYILTVLRREESNFEYITCAQMAMFLSKRYQAAVIDYEFGSDECFGVHNIGRKHWVLVIFKFNSRELVIVDPLGELSSTLMKMLSSWINYLKLKRDANYHQWRVVTPSHPKQQDSTSCGVYCLMFAEKYISRESLDIEASLEAVASFRENILQTILENPDEELILKLCRICSRQEPRCKDEEINWVGCDRCGMYWCHFSCMKVKTTFSVFTSEKWFCRFCK